MPTPMPKLATIAPVAVKGAPLSCVNGRMASEYMPNGTLAALCRERGLPSVRGASEQIVIAPGPKTVW